MVETLNKSSHRWHAKEIIKLFYTKYYLESNLIIYLLIFEFYTYHSYFINGAGYLSL
ncbi:MAG: hypothetical protein ACI9O3_000182 [Colwellia sp.]|jgi:hypothetical protein